MDFDRLAQIPDFVSQFFEFKESEQNPNANGFHCCGKDEPGDESDSPSPRHDCCIICHTIASTLPALPEELVSELVPVQTFDSYIYHLTPKNLSDIWQPPKA